MPNDNDKSESMLNYAKLENQKNLIGLLIQNGFGNVYDEEDLDELIHLVLGKLEVVDALRGDLIKNDEQLNNIAIKSDVAIDSVVDYFIFISLLIENSFITKRALDIGIDIYNLDKD